MPTAELKQKWLRILTEGNAGLFVLCDKVIEETKPYGSATIEHIIRTSKRYYMLMNERLVLVKMQDVLPLLKDKAGQLQLYMKEKNLSDKNEEDWIKLFDYYNSLHKPTHEISEQQVSRGRY